MHVFGATGEHSSVEEVQSVSALQGVPTVWAIVVAAIRHKSTSRVVLKAFCRSTTRVNSALLIQMGPVRTQATPLGNLFRSQHHLTCSRFRVLVSISRSTVRFILAWIFFEENHGKRNLIRGKKNSCTLGGVGDLRLTCAHTTVSWIGICDLRKMKNN